jgi:hypothetical protein
MPSKEEKSKTLVLEAFNTLFNKRYHANTNRPEADLDVFS